MMRLVSLLALFSIGVQAADNSPELISVDLEKSLAAVGFDDNDITQVSVQGELAGTCEKVGPVTATVDKENKTILISQKAYRYRGVCLNVPIPFTLTVDVGIVPAEKYTVVDASSRRVLGAVEIKASNKPEAGDHFYAPVTDAYITDDPQLGKALVLNIAISDSCTRFTQKPEIGYYPHTIVVQPIADRASQECLPTATVKTEKRFAIASGLSGEFLLHVRSRDGKSVNKVVTLD